MGDSKCKSQRKKQKRFLHWLSLMSTIKSHIRKGRNPLPYFRGKRSGNMRCQKYHSDWRKRTENYFQRSQNQNDGGLLMEKTIFEQMGGTYSKVGDYNLPNLILPQGAKLIGLWGQRHAKYLEQRHKVLYMNLLTGGKLNDYLDDIDKRADKMFSRLVTEYSDRQGVTEQLKTENQFLWLQKMNNILAYVREIVENEIIYS